MTRLSKFMKNSPIKVNNNLTISLSMTGISNMLQLITKRWKILWNNKQLVFSLQLCLIRNLLLIDWKKL